VKWLDLTINAAVLLACAAAALWGLQTIKPGLGWAAIGVGGLLAYWRMRSNGQE